MAIKKVRLFGDPILRKKCAKIRSFGSHETLGLERDLFDTLRSLQRIHKKGGGLAAPQIGVPMRMTYIHAKGQSFAVINPVIKRKSKDMFKVWDFCFSENATFLAQVMRHKRIVVEYQDPRGDMKGEEFSGYFSELLQHEIDHLNGILFVDRLIDPASIMMVKEWDKKFKYRQ
jgi:peptide deformylase